MTLQQLKDEARKELLNTDNAKLYKVMQTSLLQEKIEFEYVKSVIGSGYEVSVADLALRDKVAYRAARKNMQIHSAIILKIDSVFSGFFTFQINHEAKEFCLLQSAMEKEMAFIKKTVLWGH